MKHIWPALAQKRETFRLIGYEPSALQWPVHRSRANLIQVVGGEGGGKSFVTAAEILACLPWCRLIYLVGQTYENCSREFEYLEGWLGRLEALGAVSKPKHGKWQLDTLNQCHIETISVERGAASIIALGDQPDLIAVVEAGEVKGESVMLAAIRRAGRVRGRVILAGSLNDDYGWYARLIDELKAKDNIWQGESFTLPAWSNRGLYPGGRDDPEIKRLELTLASIPGEFERRIAGERVKSNALVLGTFSYEHHVRPCPFDPNLPVTLWIDPGWFPGAYVVLAVQFHGEEVWNFDEVYLHGHIHDQVIQICREKAWWHWVERAVIDVAGRQHHAEKSASEVWALALERQPQSRPVGVMDGIYRHLSFLGNPAKGIPARLFHDPCCRYTCQEYLLYRKPVDKSGQPTSQYPIDKNNHSMKAIAYGLVAQYGFVERERPAPSAVVDMDLFGDIDRERPERWGDRESEWG